jgi:short subunit dehydrogenase-like uncharacterized protein
MHCRLSFDFLLYGASGFTGRLITRRAVQLGLRPLLAARDEAAVRALAEEHRLTHRSFELDDAAALDDALAVVPAVLHAAGPFVHTAAPMVEACLRTGTAYLDITGELDVFERLHAMDAIARAGGVLLLPGVGFDIVATDLLAAHLKRRLPAAVRLRLAFHAPGGMSRGTAATMVENLGRGGVVRRNRRITAVPPGWRRRTVDFGFGTRPARVTTIPWGDVSTAYHSTGIPDVEVYTRATAVQHALLVASRRMGWLVRATPVQQLIKVGVRAAPPGPAEENLRRGASFVWGQVEDDVGRRATARLRAPNAYTLTAMTAVDAMRRVLDGAAPAGFQTPSLAWGPDWILELEGVFREDVD